MEQSLPGMSNFPGSFVVQVQGPAVSPSGFISLNFSSDNVLCQRRWVRLEGNHMVRRAQWDF